MGTRRNIVSFLLIDSRPHMDLQKRALETYISTTTTRKPYNDTKPPT